MHLCWVQAATPTDQGNLRIKWLVWTLLMDLNSINSRHILEYTVEKTAVSKTLISLKYLFSLLSSFFFLRIKHSFPSLYKKSSTCHYLVWFHGNKTKCQSLNAKSGGTVKGVKSLPIEHVSSGVGLTWVGAGAASAPWLDNCRKMSALFPTKNSHNCREL